MDDGAGSWCLIESDPGVFSEMVRDFGVKDVQVTEIYSLDDARLTQPTYGLIFLFKYLGEKDERTPIEYDPRRLFFAHQRIQNACATQALLSILLNTRGVDLGKELTSFREFTSDFGAEMCGEAISNSDRLRSVHNSFSRTEALGIEERFAPKGQGEAFHFIAYVPVDGHLYELDGLKAGPLLLGDVPSNGDWLAAARPHIEARMARYSSSNELRFALMAVTRDRTAVLNDEMAAVSDALQAEGALDGPDAPRLLARQQEILELLDAEQALLEAQRRENARRKHNWLPFIFALLGAMADNDKLVIPPPKAK